MNAFLHGAGDLWQGLRLIGRPGLRRWVMIPIAVSALIYGLLFMLAANTLLPELNAWLDTLPDWLQFLRGVIFVILVIAGLLLVALSFTLIANLVGSPFNGLLAEALIRERAPALLPHNAPPLLQGSLLSIGRESRKLLWIARRVLLLVLLWLLSLLLLWVPGVNIVIGSIITALWFVFGAWAMSVEYCDYPLDATGQPFAALPQWLQQHRLRSLGLGAAAALCAMVPFANILVMPAAVCAGTLLWLDTQATKPQ